MERRLEETALCWIIFGDIDVNLWFLIERNMYIEIDIVM